MKLLPILALLALLPCHAENATPPSPDKAVVDLVYEQALEPIEKRQLSVGAFSRVRLETPVLEWGVDLGNGLRSFTIHHGYRQVVAGLVRTTDLKVYLLDSTELRYVPAAEHTLVKELSATPEMPKVP